MNMESLNEVVGHKNASYGYRRYVETPDLQLERVNVYYNKASCGRFVPRAVLKDLEQNGPKVIIRREWSLSILFLLIVRKGTKNCDSLQDFLVCHSWGDRNYLKKIRESSRF